MGTGRGAAKGLRPLTRCNISGGSATGA